MSTSQAKPIFAIYEDGLVYADTDKLKKAGECSSPVGAFATAIFMVVHLINNGTIPIDPKSIEQLDKTKGH